MFVLLMYGRHDLNCQVAFHRPALWSVLTSLGGLSDDRSQGI